MSNPPPLPPLRRNISRSLENISEVAANYKKKREPALPPRPARPLPEKRLPPTPRYEPEYEAINVKRKIEVSVPLSEADLQSYDLETFCKKVKLPQAAEVTDGFCGPTEDIPVGYKLMLYFQKTTRFVQAKDVLETVYNIPLNSSLQFALIDDLQPKGGDFSGFYYDTVEKMLQECSTLPKVICAKGGFTKGKHSVNPNDILFPKKIDKSTLGSKVVGLHCTKIGGEDVKLPLDCACGFSTDVANTQLYLPEYIEYVNQFPVKVKVFGIDTNVQVGMPNTLTLVAEHLLRSLVTRSLHDEEEIITEISMDVPIRIRCLYMDNVVSEQERVKKTYETFATSKVSNVYSVTTTNAQYKAQQQLFTKVRQECDSKYYEIIAPESIGNVDTLQSKSSSDTLSDAAQSSPKPSRHRIFKTNLLKHRTQSAGDEESLDNSDTAASPVQKHKLRNLLPGRHRPQSAGDGGTDEVIVDNDAPSQPTNIDLKQEFAALTESMKVEMKAEIKEELERSLREDIRKLRIDNAHCLQQLTRMNEMIEQLKNQNNSAPLSSPHIKPAPSHKPAVKSVSSNSLEEIYKMTPKDNRKFLQSLDHLKILQLLDGMKLERYKSEFKESFVDGQLLATLCQTELVELKVNSSLHQRKLLNVIEGKVSAQKYLLLGQEDPYI